MTLSIITFVLSLLNIAIAVADRNIHSAVGWLCVAAYALVVILESRIAELAK